MSKTDSVYEAVVIPDLTDTGRKLKNNVVMFSVISIFMFFGNVSISEKSSFLGFIFNGLTQEKIYIGLVLIIAYSSIHYAFLLKDSLSEWMLRCSVVYEECKSGSDGDLGLALALQNERHNNLYFWWQFHKDYYLKLGKEAPELSELICKLKERLDGDGNQGDRELINRLSQDVYELNNYIREVSYLFRGNHLDAQLKNFNNYYRSFLIFQNVRWLIFEFAIPFILATVSLCFLSGKVSLYIF